MTIYLSANLRRNHPYTFDEPPSDFPPPYTYADALQAQIYQNSWNIQRLFKSIQILGQKVALIENNMNQYVAETRTTKKDIQFLRKEIQDLKNTLSSTANNRDDAISKLQKTVTKINLTLSSHQKNAKEENTRLKGLISSLEMRLEMQTLDLQNEVEQRKQELETVHSETRTAFAQYKGDLTNQIGSLAQQFDHLSTELERQKEQIKKGTNEKSASETVVKESPPTVPHKKHEKKPKELNPAQPINMGKKSEPNPPRPPASTKAPNKQNGKPSDLGLKKTSVPPSKKIQRATNLTPNKMTEDEFVSTLRAFSENQSRIPKDEKMKKTIRRDPMPKLSNLCLRPDTSATEEPNRVGVDREAINQGIRWYFWEKKLGKLIFTKPPQ